MRGNRCYSSQCLTADSCLVTPSAGEGGGGGGGKGGEGEVRSGGEVRRKERRRRKREGEEEREEAYQLHWFIHKNLVATSNAPLNTPL